MQMLEADDWKQIDAAISSLQQLHTLVELEHFVLERLPEMLGAKFSSWNEHNSQMYLERVTNSKSYESKVAKLLEVLNRVLPTNPCFRYFFDTETGKVRLIETVERTRELDVNDSFHSTEFYKHVASKLGIEDQLIMHIFVREGRGIVLTFHGGQEFNDTQQMMASILRGHILTCLYRLSKKSMDYAADDNALIQEVEEKITQREFEVFRWVCAGMSNHEISEKLEVSSKTVDNHVSNLFKKLELPSRHKMIAKYAPWVNVMADRSA